MDIRAKYVCRILLSPIIPDSYVHGPPTSHGRSMILNFLLGGRVGARNLGRVFESSGWRLGIIMRSSCHCHTNLRGGVREPLSGDSWRCLTIRVRTGYRDLNRRIHWTERCHICYLWIEWSRVKHEKKSRITVVQPHRTRREFRWNKIESSQSPADKGSRKSITQVLTSRIISKIHCFVDVLWCRGLVICFIPLIII